MARSSRSKPMPGSFDLIELSLSFHLLVEEMGMARIHHLIGAPLNQQQGAGRDFGDPLHRFYRLEGFFPLGNRGGKKRIPDDANLAGMSQEIGQPPSSEQILELGRRGARNHAPDFFPMGGYINRHRPSSAEPHQVDPFAVDFGPPVQVVQPAFQVARPAEDVKIPLARSCPPEIEDQDEKTFLAKPLRESGVSRVVGPLRLPRDSVTDDEGREGDSGIPPEGTSRRKYLNFRSSRRFFHFS